MIVERRLAGFIAAASGLLALFFADAFTGRVLSQADILLGSTPWFESGPAGAVASNGQRPGNKWLGDVPLFVYPSLTLTHESLRAFRVPVWNPTMYGGQPFLASYQPGVFSPTVLVTALLPPVDALLGHAVLRLLIGGVGMFLFLRRLGVAGGAVWFGGLTFLLNPFTVVWLEHPPSAVACWLPWLLWAVDRNRDDGSAGNVAALAGVIALTLLAGHPETAFKLLLLTGAYAIAVSLAGTDRRRGRVAAGLLFGRCLPAAILGAALAAAQIAPFLEYLGESGIAAMRRTFTVSALVVPAADALTAFVPDAFGNPSRGDTLPVRDAAGVGANYLERQAYPGNAAWILAAVSLAVTRRHRWRVVFLAVATIVAAALMYGAPVISQLVALIPVAGLLAPSRFGLLAIFGVVAMGAIGLSALVDAEREDAARAARAAGVALALMAVFVASMIWWRWPQFRYGAFLPDLSRAVLWSGAVAGAAVAIVVCLARGLVRGGTAAALVTIVSVVDLFALGFRFHPMIPRAQAFPAVPSMTQMAADRGLFRVAGFGNSLPPNTAMAYGLSDPRGYDGVAPRRMTDLLGRAFGAAMAHRIDARGALPVVDLLNVKYLVANDDGRPPPPHWVAVATAPAPVYRNLRAFPRAWLVDRVAVMDDAAALDWIVAPSSDLRHVAPIDAALTPDAGPDAAAAAGIGESRVSRYEPTEVEITTAAEGRRLLVLADAWYPGWEVYVDGRKAVPVRAYYALRAVAVPAGQHVVRFVYEPASLRLGLAVSGGALLVLVTLAASGNRRLDAWQRPAVVP
jgi:hypothetical protein